MFEKLRKAFLALAVSATSSLAFPGVYSDVEEFKGKEPVVCRWSNEFEKIIEKCKETGYPALMFFCNKGCYWCGKAVENALDETEFMAMINSYQNIYLGYGLSFDDFREWRKKLFKTATSSSYTGYLDGSVGLPSVVLINVDADKTTMFFHIYSGQGRYDSYPNGSYATSPYHDQIPLTTTNSYNSSGSIYAQISSTDSSFKYVGTTGTSTRFKEIVKEYLDTVVPKGPGIATTYTEPVVTNTPVTPSTSVLRNTIVTRFEIQMADVLKQNDLLSSPITNDFKVVSSTGKWFQNIDCSISASPYGQNTEADSESTIIFQPIKNGTFSIATHAFAPVTASVFRNSAISSYYITAYAAKESGGFNVTQELWNYLNLNYPSETLTTSHGVVDSTTVGTTDMIAIRLLPSQPLSVLCVE